MDPPQSWVCLKIRPIDRHWLRLCNYRRCHRCSHPMTSRWRPSTWEVSVPMEPSMRRISGIEERRGFSGTDLIIVSCRDFFYQYGEIRTLNVLGVKGCAFVTYTTRESAEMAAERSFNRINIKVRRGDWSWGSDLTGGLPHCWDNTRKHNIIQNRRLTIRWGIPQAQKGATGSGECVTVHLTQLICFANTVTRIFHSRRSSDQSGPISAHYLVPCAREPKADRSQETLRCEYCDDQPIVATGFQ